MYFPLTLEEYSHIYYFNPINFYPLIIYNRLIIVICIPVIYQGTGQIKLFILSILKGIIFFSIVLKVFINFQSRSLLDNVEGIGRYSYIRYYRYKQVLSNFLKYVFTTGFDSLEVTKIHKRWFRDEAALLRN